MKLETKLKISPVLYAIFIILAFIAAVLAGQLIETSKNTVLKYSGNLSFNHMVLYKYTLEECSSFLCTPTARYICSSKITNTSLCIIMDNQLVCEGGVVCYKYEKILKAKTSSNIINVSSK